MNTIEVGDKCWSVVETDNDNKSISVKERPQVGAPTKTFTFDKVFGIRSRQIDVYKCVVDPAIEEVIMGYNCTIFAYVIEITHWNSVTNILLFLHLLHQVITF